MTTEFSQNIIIGEGSMDPSKVIYFGTVEKPEFHAL